MKAVEIVDFIWNLPEENLENFKELLTTVQVRKVPVVIQADDESMEEAAKVVRSAQVLLSGIAVTRDARLSGSPIIAKGPAS